MELNKLEIGAVLAGLRAWRRLIVDKSGTPAELYDLASYNGTEKPLGVFEVDDLFEKIRAEKAE